MKFYSKHDILLGIFVLGITGAVAILTMVEIGLSMISFIMVLVFLFSCWVWFGTYYIFKEDRLIAKAGPFKYQILYEDIDIVTASNNPISSPACSLDRLKLKGRKTLLVSPKNKDEFIKQLTKKKSSITIDLHK